MRFQAFDSNKSKRISVWLLFFGLALALPQFATAQFKYEGPEDPRIEEMCRAASKFLQRAEALWACEFQVLKLAELDVHVVALGPKSLHA